MSMVQQTPDGNLIVRDNSGNVYIDTFANAGTDFGVQTPALPTGAIDRIYDQGVRHRCSDGHTIVGGVQPLPWPQGDSYIASVTTALTNQKNRIAAQPPPPIPGKP